MKMLNYDTRELLLQNVRTVEKLPVPEHYTKTQYKYLCKLIKKKKISKPFFQFLLAYMKNSVLDRLKSYFPFFTASL